MREIALSVVVTASAASPRFTAAVVALITRLAGDDSDVRSRWGQTREIHKRLTDIQWVARDPYG